MSRLPNRRIRFLLALFTLAFAAMLGRAFWLQAVQAGTLERLAAEQHHATIELAAGRGTIYDRNGVELAIGEQATTVYANPRQVPDPRAAAAAIGRALELDPEELYPKLADRSRGFVYLKRKADAEKAAAVEKLDLEGIGFLPEERRVYPQGRVGAHVIGYAGLDNRGLAGLELALDRDLAGRAGRRTIVRDPLGRAIDVVGERQAADGRSVTLTLDQGLQGYAENVLRRTVSQWGAKAATAIVLDPRTGAILAMAVEPGFDANRFPQASRDLQRNRAVTDTHEPGSTFKVVTVAAALTEGLVSPKTEFTLQYEIQIADRRIHDAHKRGTERMTVEQILSRSSNVGTVTLALMLGPDRLSQWISRFGYGKTTGLDFPGETGGIVPSLERWSGSTIGTLPMGHGIAVTPVQMAAAYGAVANRGVWTRPHLVTHVTGRRPAKAERRRIISPTVAAQVMKMLKDVVSDGTGPLAAVPGYQVAGKTGTAAKPEGDGYSESRYIASFVGIVPASAPRLVIAVAVDEPHGAIWGGEVAAPAFREIARYALQYLEIPPDGAPPAAVAP